jgi:carboxyl-terminal processing protease
MDPSKTPKFLPNARDKRGALLGVLLGVLCGIVGGASFAYAVPEGASPYANLKILARALAHIEASYVEEVDQDALIYGAIRGMVESLDPHTAFMAPDEYRILSDDTEGAFGGVGVEIQLDDGWLTVMNVFASSPAARAGIKAGDRFLEIDGKDARDLRILDAVRMMRGKEGSSVKLLVRRGDADAALKFELKREVIRLEALEWRLIEKSFVHVKLKTFSETTTTELRDALDAAVTATRKSGGVRGVILDLRNNAGGLLDQSVLVADEFLDGGTIVSTRGRGEALLSESRAVRSGTRPPWPVVVLVNRYSASAAEIVAAALRDHGRAIVVGERTFGKGSVQTIIELPDASALKLTVARYYSPRGRSIQAAGVQPDVVVADAATTVREQGRDSVSESTLDRHLPVSKRGEPPPPLDADWRRAVETRAVQTAGDDAPLAQAVALLVARSAAAPPGR